MDFPFASPYTPVRQTSLFACADAPPTVWPEGLVHQPDWLSAAEESTLTAIVRDLPFEHARYKGYTARRRVVGYGGRFDYDRNRLLPTMPLVASLHPLRARVATWMGVAPDALDHVLVSEYAPGTPLGWHRDVPDFEDIVGVSLGSAATLRFRPYPHRPGCRDRIVPLVIEPRSIYRMHGPSRWGWQHAVMPVGGLRWSITFRTRRP